ncbi:hypothetical protein GALL_496120 [mine drainage metagenome]|uniref:Uncharacterized protein n=1 Tax=mine drainage metagenome TaxID=410659 RepID=A0A1J5PLX0_9ZZZZ
MAVVSAGVHDARVVGGVLDAAGFVDRQGVHIGAQADGAVGLAPADGADDSVAADAGGKRDTEFSQALLDEGGGVGLVQGEFGVGVKVAPPAGQPVVQGFIHGGSGLVGFGRCYRKRRVVMRGRSIPGGCLMGVSLGVW